MNTKKTVLLFLLLLLFLFSFFGQSTTGISSGEMDAQINLALDYFGQGDYEKAISLLEAVLIIDPENERAADLLVSVRELYRMERELSKTNNTDDEEFTAQRPDFSVNPTRDEETDPQEDEELNKPDFSINEEDDLVQPEETRSRFELIVSPSLVYTWDVGEEGEVFPSVGTYSASVSSEMNYYFSKWNRIVGISGGYSLLLLDPEWGSFADARLHVVDALITFRTFFQEEVDSKTVLRIGAGYRGYYAGGYNFYTLNKGWLNGFNMGVNLEGPLLYLFRSNEGLKKFIMGIDMNLLFFPEMNTLNLFDFKIEARLQFDHFSAGLHFGAYSVITPDESKYIWMNGINFRFRL